MENSPYSKPWITRDLKGLSKKKNRVFRKGGRDLGGSQRSVQKHLKKKLRENKRMYRKKLESKL